MSPLTVSETLARFDTDDAGPSDALGCVGAVRARAYLHWLFHHAYRRASSTRSLSCRFCTGEPADICGTRHLRSINRTIEWGMHTTILVACTQKRHDVGARHESRRIYCSHCVAITS